MGESTDTVQRGLQGGAAAMLSGLASRADEPGFLSQIFGLITNPANTGSAVSALTANPTAALSEGSPLTEMAGRFLTAIFGSRVGGVTDALGQFSGMGASKAGTLLTMAAPLVLGGLGRFVRENDVTASSFAASLKSEAPKLQGFLPAGLSGLFSRTPTGAGAAVPARAAAATTNRWLWPVVILSALLLAALWFFNRSRAPVSEGTQMASNADSSAMTGLGDFFKTRLPNGVELNVPQFGIESKLLSFIQDASKPVDDTTWFNFDRLRFDTAKSKLEMSSEEQLNNIAEILKAYPKIHVKIGGYTDNTGNPEANKELSEARAKSVMSSLADKGIDSSRMEAEGYGDQYPVGDNSTAEGRAKNRRIALRVTER
jgi:outer membrane protein OmpA-like peptidoglycan-associated protein